MSSPINDPFVAFRRLFPGVRNAAYMDVSARGLLSSNVRQAIDGYLDMRAEAGGDKAAMFAMVQRCREAVAELVGSDADEVGFVKNISDGVNGFATALDWKPGDTVVQCTALEHPANILPWQNLARERGVVLKSTPADRGAVPIDAMIAAIDARTRVVATSTVSFAPGFRAPLAELGAACRARGVHLVVDSAQSLGQLATDVRADGIDVLLASTQKGLLGLYGQGFMYVRRELAESLRPVYLSRFGVELDSEHEAASSGFENFRHAPGARRFDVGNFNYLAACAAERSIRDLLELGPRAIETHVTDLARRLRDGLAALDLPVFRAPPGAADAHIVAIGSDLIDEHDGARDADMRSLHEHLAAGGVAHSIRRGVLRLSLHAYNDRADIDRALELAAAWRRR